MGLLTARAAHETRHVRSSSRGSCSEGHSHGFTPVHGERAPRVHPPHCPALWRSGSNSRGGGRTVHHHATSPPLTSPHARPLVSARHPSQRQPRSFHPNSPRGPSLTTACQPDVPACMLRVTAAPAPSYAGSVVHVAALRASEGLCHSARAEHTQPPCLQWDGAWLGLYSVTGCTADSSRVQSGAWWWHRTRAGGVCPRGGETHPPYIEDIVECGHLHHHGRTVALTHGELPLHPNYGYPRCCEHSGGGRR